MTNQTKRYRFGMVTLCFCLLHGMTYAADRGREQKYQQAVDLFESKGDLKGAIKLFEEASKSPDRNLAARSLLYLGACYEKLGQNEAQKAYERIVRDFADQHEVIGKARERLAALGKATESSVVARRIWASSPGDSRVFGASVSLDGRYVPFLDYVDDSIGIRDTATGEEHQVLRKASPSDPNFNWVDISPDGKKLAYCHSQPGEPYQLYIIDVDGSNRRHIGEGSPHAWSPDGRYILATTRGAPPNLVLLSAADGSSRLTISGASFASFSPDGRYIAFIRAERGARGAGPIFVMPANGGPESQFVDGHNQGVIWTPDSKGLVFVSNRRGSDDLWSIHVADGKPEGPPQMLQENVGYLVGISQNGDVYYETGHAIADIYSVDVDPQTGKLTSRPKRITTRYINGQAAWSPDGESLVYYSQRGRAPWIEGGVSIIVRNMKTGEERTVPLRNPLFLQPHHPYWFPDGRSVFASLFGRLIELDLQTGEDRQLLSPAALFPAPIGQPTAALAPDGRSVYYLARGERTNETRLVVCNLDGSGQKELFQARQIRLPAVSRDNSRVAFLASSSDGGWAVFTAPTAGGTAKELYRQHDSALLPSRPDAVWSKDGKRIFFCTGGPDGRPHGEIWSIAADGGKPEPLGIGMGSPRDLDLHPDGKQLVFTNAEFSDNIWVLKNALKSSR